MNFDQKIQQKANGLRGLLARDYPHLLNKQASIIKGSPEWGCWHSGYYVALCDVLRLMNTELENATTRGRLAQDNDN